MSEASFRQLKKLNQKAQNKKKSGRGIYKYTPPAFRNQSRFSSLDTSCSRPNWDIIWVCWASFATSPCRRKSGILIQFWLNKEPKLSAAECLPQLSAFVSCYTRRTPKTQVTSQEKHFNFATSKIKKINLTIDLLSLGIYVPGPQVLTQRPQILRGVRIWSPFRVPGPERRVKRFRCFRKGRG